MSIMLSPDDIECGAYVTVLQPRNYRPGPPRTPLHDFLDSITPTHRECEDDPEGDEIVATAKTPVPAGVPLQVIGISLPFVACSVIQPGGGAPRGPAIIDIRRTQLARADASYVEALHAFNAPPPEAPKAAPDEPAPTDDAPNPEPNRNQRRGPRRSRGS